MKEHDVTASWLEFMVGRAAGQAIDPATDTHVTVKDFEELAAALDAEEIPKKAWPE